MVLYLAASPDIWGNHDALWAMCRRQQGSEHVGTRIVSTRLALACTSHAFLLRHHHFRSHPRFHFGLLPFCAPRSRAAKMELWREDPDEALEVLLNELSMLRPPMFMYIARPAPAALQRAAARRTLMAKGGGGGAGMVAAAAKGKGAVDDDDDAHVRLTKRGGGNSGGGRREGPRQGLLRQQRYRGRWEVAGTEVGVSEDGGCGMPLAECRGGALLKQWQFLGGGPGRCCERPPTPGLGVVVTAL